MKAFGFFLLICVLNMSAFAQQPALEVSKEAQQRAQSLCPEVAKLAEVIALARDNGRNIDWTTTIVHNSILPTKNEILLIQDLLSYVYEHPNMTPYEHFKNAGPACYVAFGVTSE